MGIEIKSRSLEWASKNFFSAAAASSVNLHWPSNMKYELFYHVMSGLLKEFLQKSLEPGPPAINNDRTLSCFLPENAYDLLGE